MTTEPSLRLKIPPKQISYFLQLTYALPNPLNLGFRWNNWVPCSRRTAPSSSRSRRWWPAASSSVAPPLRLLRWRCRCSGGTTSSRSRRCGLVLELWGQGREQFYGRNLQSQQQHEFFQSGASMTGFMEAYLKGKTQYSWDPCANKSVFNIEIIICLFKNKVSWLGGQLYWAFPFSKCSLQDFKCLLSSSRMITVIIVSHSASMVFPLLGIVRMTKFTGLFNTVNAW